MLIYAGYRYVQNRQSVQNRFWRCSSYVKYGCRARVVTSKCLAEPTIRRAGSWHSHGAELTAGGSQDDLSAYMRTCAEGVAQPAEPTDVQQLFEASPAESGDESGGDGEATEALLMWENGQQR